ncbi:TetR/AcrR family transcriptional regulator [Corynebacterium glyciniphilum]|uniref:TetR/AcrR family transcriptional regulator n=1 Tax=Corynebacterium glyciniphilum TaxID=1404244 RepID=UPI002654066F|nr:TetR/AcrR family transcriptional regulator [Corynebacterium glyciniphilum]MDN5682623.1 TetR/AcrR family transcriptional regulator [Corynebacterium glyciniphilum]MDN6705920.1 TetR/AcrR family transcriptional regulator [Corynebacterium glyciniphilum]
MTQGKSGDNPTARTAGARGRLLSAAAEAFADRGFHGTTTRDIAGAAGMSPAAVYVHFPSKEELLYQLMHDGHLQTLAVMDDADLPDAPAPQRLASVMSAFARYHALEHTGARVVNYELASLSAEHAVVVSALRREVTARLRDIVDAGVAEGEFRTPDSRTCTEALLSMGVDIARWYRDGVYISPDELADFYAQLALRCVGRDLE